MIWALLLGLAAAFLFALSAFLQQRVARTSDHSQRSVVARASTRMLRLIRDRRWLTGWFVNMTGFLTQAAALHLGSVATVQPLMSTQLVFAMPMSSLERKSVPPVRDWASALAICLGLAVLKLSEGAAPLSGHADRTSVLLVVVSIAALITVALFIAGRAAQFTASIATSVAAGLCFAMSAVFMKLTADALVHHGVAATARDWVGYALAASTLTGLVLEQEAFANGPLPWSLATMNAVNPVASYVVGVVAFPTPLPDDLLSLAGIAVAGVLVVAGGAGLAHSPSTRIWFPRSGTSPRHAG